jgi:hypothetical protein
MEALLVRQHVKSLVGAGVRPEDIAVVTPYNAQVWHHTQIVQRTRSRAATDYGPAPPQGILWI